jgi:Xaa-Pro dipeptidase
VADTHSPAGGVRLPSMNIHDKLGFGREEYERRYARVLKAMQARGIDVLLVRGPENICYLTGYDTAGYYGYHCLVILPDDEPIMVVRRLERSNVDPTSWLTRAVPTEDHQDPVEVLAATLRELGVKGKALGIEKAAHFVNVSEYEKLRARLPDERLVDSSGVVESARVVKSDAEVEMIRCAVRIADRAMQAGLDAVQAGISEDEIAARVHEVWCREGAE